MPINACKYVGMKTKQPIFESAEDRLTPHEAAELLGVKSQTLALWRCTGRHDLPFTRCGSRIFYSRAAIDEWLSRHSATSTAALAASA